MSARSMHVFENFSTACVGVAEEPSSGTSETAKLRQRSPGEVARRRGKE